MLNSLYGIKGIQPIKTESIITPTDKVGEIANALGVSKLNNDYSLVDVALSEFLSDKPLINVALSAAIAAYSRVEINKYKMLPNNPCFYSDTDSVVLQHPLPSNLIGSAIG